MYVSTSLEVRTYLYQKKRPTACVPAPLRGRAAGRQLVVRSIIISIARRGPARAMFSDPMQGWVGGLGDNESISVDGSSLHTTGVSA